MHQGHENRPMSPEMVRRHYSMLAVNLILSAIIMYLVMFTMIDTVDDFFNNLNALYMTAMMVSPMAILMLLTMRMMYPDRRLNFFLYGLFAVIFVLGWVGMRDQTLIGDRQFLQSMIPHHSGAVLMCERSAIQDPEIKQLCDGIVASQKAEIAQMKTMLAR